MENKPINKIYGENVFSDSVMEESLPKEVYDEFHKTIDEGRELSLEIADIIASEMKTWAIEKNATHFTHWFQPLTGFTAEKQDAFISAPDASGNVIMEFTGKSLIKGENDASSFPSGGLRATFEARGYTAWDATSPAFIREDALGATLCIPTIFCSYNGEALDQKTPLLKSMDAINKEAVRLLRILGNTTSKKVVPMVGAEQEYFLVDLDTYKKRKDLVFTDRTLFGVMPPKGQELDDHYYGNIKERVGSFMKDVNEELWKMGIPAKTQHNEVAPGQHEIAPVYEPCNTAVDHNQVVMRTLQTVAERHDLKCILNEKPFSGVNGSGKHNNWSLVTDDGINLLKPGRHPHDNITFLVILTCVLKAVDDYSDLIRESAANFGNEHRLGGDEAPPSIISVFLGEQLEDVLEQYIRTGDADHSIKGGKLNADLSSVPTVNMDANDRNRTSPFAFTGNKFEFRMVGSKDSIAGPNIVLNTIVADAFSYASDILSKADDITSAAKKFIQDTANEHQRIVFNGNGYSKEWEAEAKRRGLNKIDSMVDAIPSLITPKSIKLFEKFGVFTEAELRSRYEIQLTTYSKMIRIEARAMIDIAGKHIIPAVMRYTKDLAKSAYYMTKLSDITPDTHLSILKDANNYLHDAYEALNRLKKLMEKADELDIECPDSARFYYDNICPAMEELRKPIDLLELIVDKNIWPMPSYGDLLFNV